LLGDNVERFLVDADSGVITTAVVLDREEVQGYHLTLVAQDSSVTEPRASAVNLTVTVLDENDNTPHFSSERYIVHVPDHTQPGMTTTTIIVHFLQLLQHYVVHMKNTYLFPDP
jgi:protocadherin Fat 4